MAIKLSIILACAAAASCIWAQTTNQAITEPDIARSRLYLDIARLAVSVLGSIGTITALAFGVVQYRNNQKWRRAEFIARETKEFANDPVVRTVMTMIDWGERKVDLARVLLEEGSEVNPVLVTRETQWRALLPHTLYIDESSQVRLGTDEYKRNFSEAEEYIRDAYDDFLGWLEAFQAYLDTGLIDVDELKPHLKYWINDIARSEGSAEDCRWRCALITYIHFYRCTAVVRLFRSFCKDISHSSGLYSQLEEMMQKPDLATALRQSIGTQRPGAEDAP